MNSIGTRAAIAAYVLTCALVSAGCSSSDSAKQAQGASGTGAATASAAPTSSEPAVEAASDDAAFPVYPNAKSQPIPAGMGHIEMCGHKQSITQYAVDADGKAVVDWYKSRLANAVSIDVGAETGEDASDAIDKNLSVEFLQPDGSSSVMVMQMHFASAKLQAASKTIDMDKTTISFVHYDPPLGSDYVQLMSQAIAGDASARAAAKAKFGAMCPDK